MRGTVDRLLPPGTGRRAVVGVVGSLVLAVGFLRFALPQGTPWGVLASGGVTGLRTSLLAAGLILVYRSQRFVNFAQVALGAVGASVAFELGAVVGVPFLIAVPVGVVLSVVFAIAVELVFVRRFFRSPRLVLTVVTIVLSTVLPGAAQYLKQLPFWPSGRRVSDIRAAGVYRGPFDSWRFEIHPLSFGFPEVLTVVVVVVALAGLAAFLRFSRMGTAIRGSAENADRALLLGINVGLLSTVVWGICGALGGLFALLAGMSENWKLGSSGAALLLPSLAAVVLARMSSIPLAVVASVGLGMGRVAFNWSYPASTMWNVVVLAVLCLGLLVQRSRQTRVDEGLSSSWKATEEVRPTPRLLLAIPAVRRTRRALIAVGALFLLAYPQAVSPGSVHVASLIPVYMLITLSLVVLTGWGGQVSLGQVGFVAFGQVVGAVLAVRLHLPMVVGLPLTAVICAAVAAIVGVPALRLKGPFLAVTTFAFATAVSRVLLNPTRLGALGVSNEAGARIVRPAVFFVGLGDERSWYYFSLALVVLAAVVVRRLRAGRPGRVLIAIREDDKGVQTFAIDAVRTRLSAFMLSGALAGVAGWLWLFQRGGMGSDTMLSESASISMFIVAMAGGITSVSGAALGAVFYGFTTVLTADEQLQHLTQGLPLLLLLFASPGGLASLVYRLRDSVLRLVAIRRRIVVPSLFADVDPEVLYGRKVAFAEPSEGRGLEALPHDRRYELTSELYPKEHAAT